jgi:SAM-dependent methyltransferase
MAAPVIGARLVHPLEDAWREHLHAIATKHRWPSAADAPKLAPWLRALSEHYNLSSAPGPDTKERLAARLGFSFARDVPKGAAAVRELVALGAIADKSEPLRVLDLGAGLGAMTWGLCRALRRAGIQRPIESLLVDADEQVLALAKEIGAAPPGEQALRIATHKGSARRPPAGAFDVVLVGQVLSEMDHELPVDERVASHAEFLSHMRKTRLAPGGALVVVEPALRERTRHLHAVRDQMLAADESLRVFAPCTHRAGCPMLDGPADWCHEDLPVDLPSWLVPLARAAGLRFEGLTFAYLVLREDGAGMPVGAGPGEVLRVVSSPIPSKGKLELFVCGQTDVGPTRVRVRRLHREGTAENEAFESLVRGDLARFDPAPATKQADPARPREQRLPGDTSVVPVVVRETR